MEDDHTGTRSRVNLCEFAVMQYTGKSRRSREGGRECTVNASAIHVKKKSICYRQREFKVLRYTKTDDCSEILKMRRGAACDAAVPTHMNSRELTRKSYYHSYISMSEKMCFGINNLIKPSRTSTNQDFDSCTHLH